MFYVRVMKVAMVPVNEDLSYKKALAYGSELDRDDCLEFDLYIDIVNEDELVVDEMAWNKD